MTKNPQTQQITTVGGHNLIQHPKSKSTLKPPPEPAPTPSLDEEKPPEPEKSEEQPST